MQTCGTSTEKGSFEKRVTVRTGGAGYAHSGVKRSATKPENGANAEALTVRLHLPKRESTKIVTLGS